MVTDPLARRSALFGWACSIAVHLGVVAFALLGLAAPDSGFEFQAPLEVELGLVEATAIEVAPPAATAMDEATAPTATGAADGEGPGARDAGVPRDAGPRRPRRDAGVDAAAERGIGEGAPVAFLPAGAQIALRIDMDRVRTSPIGEDVASMLRAVPDWQALLGGSDVDPVRDLSRVLIATPNLQRSRVVVAGRLSDDAPDARTIAERLATAQGAQIDWREEAGVPATTWPSPDETVRDVALLGDRHFVIARPEDLPRVLAIAAARRRRGAEQDPADALLSMEPGEGVSIEIENVGAFVRRNPCPAAPPLRLRGGMREGEGVHVHIEARFARAEDASESGRCLEDLARRYAGNVIVGLYGLSGPLDRLAFRADEETLRIETRMTYAEIRTVLGLVRGLFARPPPPPSPPPTPPPPPPTPPTPLPPAEPPPSPFD